MLAGILRLTVVITLVTFALISSVFGHQSNSQKLPVAGQEPRSVTVLEVGKAVARELSGGEKHVYQLALPTGQHVKLEIKSEKIRTGMAVQGPDGSTIKSITLAAIALDPEFSFVSASSGNHLVTIYTTEKASPGRYELRITEFRVATENDKALYQANKSFAEYSRLARDGRYSEALPGLLGVVEIRERVLGSDHPLVGLTLSHLADAYGKSGDYATAIQIRLRALEIKKKLYGLEHLEVVHSLHSLGITYQEKGDYLKAEEMHSRALSILEKLKQPNSLIEASILSYLGDIYYSRTDYKAAEQYFRRSQAILEQRLGPDHFHLTATMTTLGLVAYAMGDYPKAEAMFQRALALTEKNLGVDSVRVPRFLNDLGRLYCTTGDYKKAESFYQRALSIHQRGGLGTTDAQETLFGLARVYAAQGRILEAVKFEAEASAIENRHVELNMVQGSEREKLAYLDNLSFHSFRNISLHAQLAPENETARTVAVTGILQRKGRVQDSMSAGLSALRERFTVEDQKVLDQLRDVTSKLAGLVLRVPQAANSTEYEEQIQSLEKQREHLEEEISRRSAGFYKRSVPVTVRAVQEAIPAKAALIEFAVYKPFDPKAPDDHRAFGEPHYIAYVLRSQSDIRWIELGEAKLIDDAVQAMRAVLGDPGRKNVKQIARALDEQVMHRVRVLAGDVTELLVSPDGALNLLPFESLVDENGRYLVERYSVSYLTSGRDLLRMQVGRNSPSNSLVLADPLFGEPRISRLAKVNERNSQPPAGRQKSTISPSDPSQLSFERLSGTKLEAKAIMSLFPEATLLTGTQATEARLKGAVAPRLLHIATHGFFLTARSASMNKETRKNIRAEEVENPLLRSGLALAGANLRSNGNDDGVLTALEASGLNLWGTKLVTLSACDTGLGDVKNGEGVYGLRRAFMLAGTETLVMSLWPVSDYMTREIMRAYYTGLRRGEGRREALRQVKLRMLKRKGRDHPHYWASFIQTGEWGNLDGKR